jgi:hypothetical protein
MSDVPCPFANLYQAGLPSRLYSIVFDQGPVNYAVSDISLRLKGSCCMVNINPRHDRFKLNDWIQYRFPVPNRHCPFL